MDLFQRFCAQVVTKIQKAGSSRFERRLELATFRAAKHTAGQKRIELPKNGKKTRHIISPLL